MTENDGRCMNQQHECPEHGRHYGKFQNCLSESVWMAALDDTNEEGGDATDGPGYFALLTGMQDYDMPFPDPAYILEVHNSGAVYVYGYASNLEAEEAWNDEYLPIINEWEDETYYED